MKVKICGLRTVADAACVNAAGADYGGMVFAPGKRQVSAGTAAQIRAALDGGIQTVGVFVNHPVSEVAALCNGGIVNIAQLHGDEDAAYIAALRGATAVPIIKMVPVGESLPEIPTGADYILFDTLSPARGGTGKAFNWALLRGYTGPPFFLAGGLHPGNVAAAIQAARPWCVDVSSGVETNGVKDPHKIQEFVTNAKEQNP